MHMHRQPHLPLTLMASSWNVVLALGLVAVLMGPVLGW